MSQIMVAELVATIGGRKLELIGLRRFGELPMIGNKMVTGAKKANIYPGKEIGAHLIKHRDEIPDSWRACYIILPNWRMGESVAFIYLGISEWYQNWYGLAELFGDNCYLIRDAK
jgi:hypothetical protein